MSHFKSLYDRRQFLIGSSALSLTAGLMPAGASAQVREPSGEPAEVIPNADALRKFNPDGTKRAFAGNTVICHVPVQTMVHDAITALGDELRSSAFAGKLGVLPSDSYHMTIFPGANDQARSAYSWPADVPRDATMAECDRVVGGRMKQFHTACDLPVRVKVDVAATLAYGRACTLRMLPLDAAENAKLRLLRDRLAVPFGFRTKDHDTYTFHITVAYAMAPFTAGERSMYQAMLERHLPRIVAAKPVLELGVPEFCTFEDMYRFEVRTLLAT